MKAYYERNTEFLTHPLNLPFEKILWMTNNEFRQWCIDLRKLIVKLWDEKGQPPLVGKSRVDMLRVINQMIGFTKFDLENLLVKDELSKKKEKDVIYNTQSEMSGVINGFFPTMMKVKINYTEDSTKGKSIYDFFAKPELLERFITYSQRHFKRDSFYHYSLPVEEWDVENHEKWPCTTDAKDWIRKFEETYRKRKEYDYWLGPIQDDKAYSGYNEKLKTKKYLTLSRSDIESLGDLIPSSCKTNVDWDRTENYRIRTFEFGQELFPLGFKAFRVSYCQVPAQFPPITARYLWERFTEHITDQDEIVLYDPSAGWGGRLLGALIIDNGIKIRYLGTDPNPDHTIKNGVTKYHAIADFVNKESAKTISLFPLLNEIEIWQLGSEVIKNDEKFQKWKGKVDMVFTSPPYGNREAYSEDPNQSYKKFPGYQKWKDEFLQPTLETAVEWLKPGRFLLWNIAPVYVDKKWVPYDEWSKEILKKLGMQYIKTIKMSMAQMPGGNRLMEDDDGNIAGTTKNICKVNGMYRKYEPVMVFYKPETLDKLAKSLISI